MARDFRGDLYGRYVSTFKGQTGTSSAGADAFWDHTYLPLLANLRPDAPILDIGCGDGRLLAYLARRGFSYARGVDISAEQIALATQRGVHATCADLFDVLPAQRQQYATIIAVDVLEHFSREELPRLVALIHAALAPGGRLIVQTANGAGLFPGQVIYGDLTHLTIFTPQSLGQLLRPCGFTDLAFFETGPVPIRVRGKLNTAVWTAIKTLASAVRYVETGKSQAIWTENFICRALRP